MPDLVLHIQTEHSPATRVLNLPGPTVRIGRGAQCELQLNEPALAEVQCILRRRGDSWNLQPVGPRGLIWIEGKPVDLTRLLPPGVSVRVGEHWLTLRGAHEPPGDLVPFIPPEEEQAPSEAAVAELPAEAAVVPPPALLSEPPEPAEPVSPHPEPSTAETPAHAPSAEAERLARWQARVEQRERWLRARAEERKWVARWRAAGATLQARAEPAGAPAGVSRAPRAPEPPQPPPRRVERPLPGYAEVARFRAAWKASPPARTPDTAPPPRAELAPQTGTSSPPPPEPVEPPPLEPAPAPAEVEESAANRPELDTSERRPRRPARPLHERTVYDPTDAAAVAPAPSVLRDAARLATAALWRPRRPRSTDSDSPPPGPAPQVEASRPLSQPDAPRSESGTPPRPDSGLSVPQAVAAPPTLGCSSAELGSSPAEPGRASPEPRRLGASRQIPGVTWREVHVSDTAQPQSAEWSPAPETLSVHRPIRGRFGPTPPAPVPAAAPPVETPTAPHPPRARTRDLPPAVPTEPAPASEWPSAREIFAARAPRPVTPTPPPPSSDRASRLTPRAVWVRPAPTAGALPESWCLPLWPAWVCATLAALVVGTCGLALSWRWAQDDASAGVVANRLLAQSKRPDRKKAEPLDPALAPQASWSHSTPGHLYRWALALQSSTAESDADRAEQVRYYLHAARNSAPAQPAVRLALAHRGPADSSAPPLADSLGLSRDVMAMSWTGQRLLEAGRADAAVRAYADALDMACRAELSDLAPPAFLDDAQVRRYALPYEDLVGPIVRELASHRDLPFQQWATALPACAVAPLAASRALRESGRAGEAEQALDLALARAEEPPLPGSSAAVQLAAHAEALALRGRWVEAEMLYRKAIDDMPHETFRRSWWLNLADIYLRLNDDAKKRQAWEAAKGSDVTDEITRRAIQSQTQAGLGAGASRQRTDASRLAPRSRRDLERPDPRDPRPASTPDNHPR